MRHALVLFLIGAFSFGPSSILRGSEPMDPDTCMQRLFGKRVHQTGQLWTAYVSHVERRKFAGGVFRRSALDAMHRWQANRDPRAVPLLVRLLWVHQNIEWAGPDSPGSGEFLAAVFRTARNLDEVQGLVAALEENGPDLPEIADRVLASFRAAPTAKLASRYGEMGIKIAEPRHGLEFYGGRSAPPKEFMLGEVGAFSAIERLNLAAARALSRRNESFYAVGERAVLTTLEPKGVFDPSRSLDGEAASLLSCDPTGKIYVRVVVGRPSELRAAVKRARHTMEILCRNHDDALKNLHSISLVVISESDSLGVDQFLRKSGFRVERVLIRGEIFQISDYGSEAPFVDWRGFPIRLQILNAK